MDLLSLVLTLKALPAGDPTRPLPPWWGRAAHALLLNVTAQYQPALADALHEPPQADADGANENAVRPFTASTLMGRFPQGTLDPQQPYTLRLTAFRQELAELLWQAATSGPLAPGATVELDYQPFRVEAAQPLGEHTSPWAASNSYQELAAPLLLARQAAPRQVSLSFTSPTSFKSGGMHMPVPLPGLTFGSLLDRWNAYAPIRFPAEVRRYAEECLAISRYKLSSRVAPVKSRGQRIGGVGEVTYTSLNYDRYWMSIIGTLAAFAIYSGVGAGASMGLGQCRQEVNGPVRRAEPED